MSEARERPILFSGPMVRAILDGRKAQTRRVVKPHPGWSVGHEAASFAESCPYGVPGDRLWVRETWNRCVCSLCDQAWPKRGPHSLVYAATYRGPSGQAFKPSIHMPRWASRITLEITEVRVQRVQEISEEDAKAEGVDREVAFDDPDLQYESHAGEDRGAGPGYFCPRSYVSGFYNIWQKLNSKRGFGWDANPWVWAITFRRII